MNTGIAEQKLIIWKAMVVGSMVGASLPLGAFVLAQIAGTAPLTLSVALLVFGQSFRYQERSKIPHSKSAQSF